MSMREERFEIDIGASPEEVWERLTTEDGLTSWFGTRASIELRVHGERTVGWGDGMAMQARITELEPHHRLRMIYTAEGEGTGAEEWLIAVDGGTTRLTLINSFSEDEIDDWEGFFGDIRRGWRLFLASLKHGLEDAASPDRVVDCVYFPATGPRSETWDDVEKALSGLPELTQGMSPILVDPPHSRLLADPGRTLLMDIEGSGDDQVLYIQASTHDGPSEWRRKALDALESALQG
jgi:uncharacterized protein YndB with AHSA1/START domain